MIDEDTEYPVIQVKSDRHTKILDRVCREEPLQIILATEAKDSVPEPLLSIMRTPGDDNHLVIGFLYAEGLIQSTSDIVEFSRPDIAQGQPDPNTIEVCLKTPPKKLSQRRFTMNSSCGLCGRVLIEDIIKHAPAMPMSDLRVTSSILSSLSSNAQSQQYLYQRTSGAHAAALFSKAGQLIQLSEDIGRHNALDKLIGNLLDKLPLADTILLVSGRLSYELVQKAVMAGICFIVAVGAPSSLAIKIAQHFDMTLVGFLRSESYTIYTGQWRLKDGD